MAIRGGPTKPSFAKRVTSARSICIRSSLASRVTSAARGIRRSTPRTDRACIDMKHVEIGRLHLVEHLVDRARRLQEHHDLSLELGRVAVGRKFGGDERIPTWGELLTKTRHLVELAHRLHDQHGGSDLHPPKRCRTAGHEGKGPLALAEKPVKSLLALQPAVHRVEDLAFRHPNFARAGRCRHREHARAPVHRQELQQIDERHLR